MKGIDHYGSTLYQPVSKQNISVSDQLVKNGISASLERIDIERMVGIDMIKIMNLAPIDYSYHCSFLVVR